MIRFSLAARTSFFEQDGQYHLCSDVPIRRLSINRGLFSILQCIGRGQSLDIIAARSGLEARRVLPLLLDLASRGYLLAEHVSASSPFPFVSIIIPVHDQPAELLECVRSLGRLDYPSENFEIIVVDDGSHQQVKSLLEGCGVSVLRRPKPDGPAAARNLGAQAARGEILAFLDADCVADSDWLSELVPFFAAKKLGAVGGRVDGYNRRTLLDRYEDALSPLNLGKRLIFSSEKHSSFYVPTCNLLVSREAFLLRHSAASDSEHGGTGVSACASEAPQSLPTRHCEARISPPKQSVDAVPCKETTSALNCFPGFDPSLTVGEDVDFCWRMRDAGYWLLYVPFGRVLHKHRNQLWKMLKRRFDYGTSEAMLYTRHPENKKRLSLPVFAGLAFLSVLAALVLLQPNALLAVPVFFALDLLRRWSKLRRSNFRVNLGTQILSGLRSYLGLFYLASFHIVRYYLTLFLIGGIFYYPVWFLAAFTLLVSSITDYLVKRPRLIYPVFLFYYTLEHLFYQTGVLWGCLKERSLACYLVSVRP